MRLNAFGLAATLAFFVVWASPAAAKDEGAYIGASIGSVTLEVDDVDFDEDDFAWKAFVGYQFNPILAIEGGYQDFGSPDDVNVFGSVDVETYGIPVYLVAGIPIGPVRAFAKGGGLYWDAEVDTAFGSADEDGTDWAVGAGLEFELGSLGVRGEVEYYDIADGALFISVGATITF